MKDLPWFKFVVNRWLSGDIQMFDHEIKGVFADMLAKLWQKGGTLQNDPDYLARLLGVKDQVRMREILDTLEECEIITRKDVITVDFITEQLQEFTELHAKRVASGRKGGKVKRLRTPSTAKAELKPSSSQAKAELKRTCSILESESEVESESDNTPLPPQGGRTTKKQRRSPLDRISIEEMTDEMKRVNTWFRRRETTCWTVRQKERFEALDKEEEDYDILEKLFLEIDFTGRDIDPRRRGLDQLINHWHDEVSKGRTEIAQAEANKPKEFDPYLPITVEQ